MPIRFIKVKAKNIFTKTKLPRCKWVINQYVGCQFSCRYCYAKFLCKWKNYDKWGSWVEIKINAVEKVKDKYVDGVVFMSSVSDPYQPIEKKLCLTRKILENMNKKVKIGIQSKSSLLLRDVDVFKKFKTIEVGLTINGFDGKLKHEIEPYSPSHKKRLNALKVLKEEKIKNYAFISPVIPGLVDVEKIIMETKGFVDKYWIEILNLKASGYEFVEWLKSNFPESYNTLINKEKMNKFIKNILKFSNKNKIVIEDLILHKL